MNSTNTDINKESIISQEDGALILVNILYSKQLINDATYNNIIKKYKHNNIEKAV